MATPDITAILQALAAQQQNAGTPSQSTPAPQHGLPQGYPGGMPHQSGTPSLGGYGLPQPTSSGSVDLSAVRPINSGSVSIAEAIAKAKSIAADRGVPAALPLGGDPRLAGRSYRRSRSRSRSPARRGGFGDNSNPYRDERRGERRGGYGRDRSPSPRGGFSPPRGRRDEGGGNTETIVVKSSLVGLIIGRSGENLRRVESETGARVQFIQAREPNATQRSCTISGSIQSREAAKREIFKVIEDNGGPVPESRGFDGGGRQQQKQPSQPALREGENSRQILVPDKTVGLIIGRGGETIRDLQERSECHVNIVSENKSINGKRPVNLIGTQEAADKAEAMIWEIVDSDTRLGEEKERAQRASAMNSGYNNGGSFNTGFDPYGGGGGRQDDGKVNESIRVPSEAVGMIIGKGGETIKDMQNQTGCKINVNQPVQPDIERQIDLVGHRGAVEAAKRVIWEKVDTVVSPPCPPALPFPSNPYKQQRDQASGRGGGGRGRDNHDGGYGQQHQPSYAQQAPPQAMPQGMPGMPAGMPQASSDPNAPDPYAAYGGYNNYIALWYASMMQQGGQQAPQGQ